MARFIKGSKEAKAYMAKIRAGKSVSGSKKVAAKRPKVDILQNGKKLATVKCINKKDAKKVANMAKKDGYNAKIYGITNNAIKNLNYLVKELQSAERNYNILKQKKKNDADWPAPGFLEMYKRYPLYIRSLKKQISEAKKNIK